MLEISGRGWNTFVGLGLNVFWVIGWLLLGALAYILINWRHLVVATSAPGLLIIFYYCILLESPKWLLSVGKIEEAERVSRRMAQLNGRTAPLDWKLKNNSRDTDMEGSQTLSKYKKVSILDLFRTPQMCTKTIILYGNWFTVILTYYGLTINSTDIGTDFHLNYIINGALEFPAYALSLVLVQFCGRRVPYAASLGLSGKALISNSIDIKNFHIKIVLWFCKIENLNPHRHVENIHCTTWNYDYLL